MKKKQIALLVLIFMGAGLLTAQKKIKKNNEMPVRVITADINKIKGSTKTVWRKCVGAGRANEGLRADWQEQLRLLKKECGFEYIRMHGLLTDDMGVYFEDKKGNPIYNWQYIDQLYDFLIDIDVKPFVELSFMPNALASGKETCFWWKGNVTPPKSYEKWFEFIKALTQHFTDRYGKEEVQTWYFEVWNEPNLKYFFPSTQEEYFKLYDFTVRAIKSVSKDYRVGGPATAGNVWITELIEYCQKNNCPIDIITTHDYGVTKGFLDADGKAGTILSKDTKAISRSVNKSRIQIKNSSKPNLELHYTEWSTSYSPYDNVHDSYQSASFILDKIKGTEDAANSMSYWTFTDIFEEVGLRTTPFHGGFGLLNYQSIKKPAYYAYQFLNQLGENEIMNNDSASWVCTDAKGGIQILLWNFTILLKSDSVNNNVFYKLDLPAKNIGKVQINLANVPIGKYCLEFYKVGYRVNDAYATYMDLGSPSQLTKQQVNVIKNANNGSPIETIVLDVNEDKVFKRDFELRENDVCLVRLIKL